ncbi:trace amine-associated receptor 4-like [Cyclopterus lumpus]|uniref:trace amine-associated receptor 4-like n=1 Tax=Cyclopterus lumpus TaxID=8103 RepID=UPI00148756CC|nr:trace amine-associated receptor 4-like [Cyclopterus lumpus]
MQLESVELCFPQLPNSSCKKPAPPSFGTALIYLILSVISLLTVALNLLVIISISHFRQLHTPTNLLLLSLAVSDFLVGILVQPVEILLKQTCWMLGDLMCSLYYVLPFIILSASVGNMVLISIDRYVAICDPLHYSIKVTHKAVTICVLLCWICSFFYALILLFDNLKPLGKNKSCYGECVVKIVVIVDLAFSFIIPITVIIVLNMKVFVVSVSQARGMRSHIASVLLELSKRDKKSERKAARTLGVLILVFLICYSPFYCSVLTHYSGLTTSSNEATLISVMYFNSCVNPIIYAIFYPWFKKTIRFIFSSQMLQPGSRDASIR